MKTVRIFFDVRLNIFFRVLLISLNKVFILVILLYGYNCIQHIPHSMHIYLYTCILYSEETKHTLW